MCGSLTFLLKPWWSIWLSCFQNGFIITDLIIVQFCLVIPTNCSWMPANKTSALSCVHACLRVCVYVRSFVQLNLNGRLWPRVLLLSCVYFGESDVIKELMMDWLKPPPAIVWDKETDKQRMCSLFGVSLANALIPTLLGVETAQLLRASDSTSDDTLVKLQVFNYQHQFIIGRRSEGSSRSPNQQSFCRKEWLNPSVSAPFLISGSLVLFPLLQENHRSDG